MKPSAETFSKCSSHPTRYGPLLLNLGDIGGVTRINGYESPAKYQNPEHQVLPSTVFSYSAHRVFLIEASDMKRYEEVCRQSGSYCLTVHSTKNGSPQACIVKGTAYHSTRFEAVRLLEIDSDNFGWLVHAVTFRMVWGREMSNFDH